MKVFSTIMKMIRRDDVDCDEVRRLSSDYLEEDLPPAKRSLIQSHIANCGPCQAFIDTLASTISILSKLPRVAAPAYFKQSILERTREENKN